MTYLFDSSAWLAHLLGESGNGQINELFVDSRTDIYISVLSIPEVFARLKALGQHAQWEDIWGVYAVLFTKILPVTEEVALRAIKLRSSTASRLPTIDCLIAATAAVHGLTLVHRDPHMDSIPESIVRKLRLSDRLN